jgi:hypothetical protein
MVVGYPVMQVGRKQEALILVVVPERHGQSPPLSVGEDVKDIHSFGRPKRPTRYS